MLADGPGLPGVSSNVSFPIVGSISNQRPIFSPASFSASTQKAQPAFVM